MKRITHVNVWKEGSNEWCTLALPTAIELAEGEGLVVEGLDIDEYDALCPSDADFE